MVILVIPLVFLMVHLVTYCKCCARDSFKQARMQRSQSNMLADFHANRGLRTSWSSVYVTDRASFTELSLLDGEGARAGHFTSSLPPVEVPVLSIQSVVLVLLMLVAGCSTFAFQRCLSYVYTRFFRQHGALWKSVASRLFDLYI